MAEIKLQRKRPSAWLWVLGALALVAAAWLLLAIVADRDGAVSAGRGGPVPAAPAATSLEAATDRS